MTKRRLRYECACADTVAWPPSWSHRELPKSILSAMLGWPTEPGRPSSPAPLPAAPPAPPSTPPPLPTRMISSAKARCRSLSPATTARNAVWSAAANSSRRAPVSRKRARRSRSRSFLSAAAAVNLLLAVNDWSSSSSSSSSSSPLVPNLALALDTPPDGMMWCSSSPAARASRAGMTSAMATATPPARAPSPGGGRAPGVVTSPTSVFATSPRARSGSSRSFVAVTKATSRGTRYRAMVWSAGVGVIGAPAEELGGRRRLRTQLAAIFAV